MVYLTLFWLYSTLSLRRKILLWPLRRILSQTPLVWKAGELAQVFGGVAFCSDQGKIIAWLFSVFRGGPKKDSRIGYFPYSGKLGSHREVLCTKFLLQICFGLWIKSGKGETSRYKDGNELVLSEMGENLSLWPFTFLSSLTTRRWDLPSPSFEM